MSEASKSSTPDRATLDPWQGIACIFWTEPQFLERAAVSPLDEQSLPVPEQVRQWLLASLERGNITVGPVTLDGERMERLLADLLACLTRLSSQQETPGQAPSHPPFAHIDTSHRNELSTARMIPEVVITTFGRFTIRCGGQEMKLPLRKGDTLCKVLLCQPGRQAESAWLLEQLWSEAEGDLAATYLHNAAWSLRQILPEGMLLTHKAMQSYQLAGQDRLWVDADAATQLLSETETLGRATAEALPPLEQAVQLFRRGRFLAGVEETWVQARRMHLETMKERALVWLAEAYGQHGKHTQAQTLLAEALAEDPTNENLLCALMQTLHEEGMTHQALRVYEEFVKAQRHADGEPAEATTALYEHLKRAPHIFDLAVLQGTMAPLLPSSSRADEHRKAASPNGSSGVAFPLEAGNDGGIGALKPGLVDVSTVSTGELKPGSPLLVGESFQTSFPGVCFGIITWGMHPK